MNARHDFRSRVGLVDRHRDHMPSQHDNPKLRRAVEIAINYRELFPTTPLAISLQQLEVLGAWLSSKPQRWRSPVSVLLQTKEDAMNGLIM